jgi:hypothetical protein
MGEPLDHIRDIGWVEVGSEVKVINSRAKETSNNPFKYKGASSKNT